MSAATRRELWKPLGRATPEPTITEAIAGLTDRVIAVREQKERDMSDTEQPSTPLPPAPAIAPAPASPASIVTKPKPRGGFAASLRALVDDARDGLDRARREALGDVEQAVGELHDAKDATKRVAANYVQTIKEEVADIRAELGQISNDV